MVAERESRELRSVLPAAGCSARASHRKLSRLVGERCELGGLAGGSFAHAAMRVVVQRSSTLSEPVALLSPACCRPPPDATPDATPTRPVHRSERAARAWRQPT